jgi:hypothetical protein
MTELDPARSLAVFLDRTTIALPARLADRAAVLALIASPSRRRSDRRAHDAAADHSPGGLTQAQNVRFPHLRGYRVFRCPTRTSPACCEGNCW